MSYFIASYSWGIWKTLLLLVAMQSCIFYLVLHIFILGASRQQHVVRIFVCGHPWVTAFLIHPHCHTCLTTEAQMIHSNTWQRIAVGANHPLSLSLHHTSPIITRPPHQSVWKLFSLSSFKKPCVPMGPWRLEINSKSESSLYRSRVVQKRIRIAIESGGIFQTSIKNLIVKVRHITYGGRRWNKRKWQTQDFSLGQNLVEGRNPLFANLPRKTPWDREKNSLPRRSWIYPLGSVRVPDAELWTVMNPVQYLKHSTYPPRYLFKQRVF